MSTTVRFAASIEVTRDTTTSSGTPFGRSSFGIRTAAGMSAKRSSMLRRPIVRSISSSSEGIRAALSDRWHLRVWPNGGAEEGSNGRRSIRALSGSMLPLLLASVVLLAYGLWWALTVIAWITWEKRFASPAKRAANVEGSETKATWKSKLVEVIEFGLPSVLSIGRAFDGMTGGRLLYSPNWSIPVPSSEGFQGFGAILLFAGLPLFTAGAYMTGRYVYARPPPERPLLERGPYRFIRHPIYLSLMLVGAGFIPLALNLGMLPLFFVFTAVMYPEREEAELIKLYGDAYREYRKRTGRFLPKIRRDRSRHS